MFYLLLLIICLFQCFNLYFCFFIARYIIYLKIFKYNLFLNWGCEYILFLVESENIVVYQKLRIFIKLIKSNSLSDETCEIELLNPNRTIKWNRSW